MADARADHLISFVDYLNSLDAHLGSLLRANRARVVQTRAQIDDSAAQLASRDGGRQLRDNAYFFPPVSGSRVS